MQVERTTDFGIECKIVQFELSETVKTFAYVKAGDEWIKLLEREEYENIEEATQAVTEHIREKVTDALEDDEDGERDGFDLPPSPEPLPDPLPDPNPNPNPDVPPGSGPYWKQNTDESDVLWG